ncbi:hypothetical protein SAMN05660909_03869 [Chitinophaga terrae (ex Kim and Jung 2007)]|uniref:Glutelin n=1 Tax=Chitinophaga terrae (ex Kim and Jung 2007) TaxID=408074 RepID=A0A1H4ENQ8_9BACT|nr:hypothetical protein [Chitinophaga terrae (ex Kim and Jung 2007)]MDQ0107621.1 hypothetical protein [Chitinophaga terrae (ex Kim and Jung 2007)]SEA86744.1 hypothetical protein SAMN05660909_03869 [Chitinophaga terrae (ex Kim and Jung 2007)]
MKKGFLMMLLMGGLALTASAQRGHGRGWGRGHDRCDDDRGRRVVYYERGYRDCRPPARVVYYPRPRYYYPAPAVVAVPVPVPPPPPVPVHYYPSRPRVVFNAGVTIAN